MSDGFERPLLMTSSVSGRKDCMPRRRVTVLTVADLLVELHLLKQLQDLRAN